MKLSISVSDFLVFQYINHLGVTLPSLNPLMRFLSEKAEYLFYLGILVYWFTPIYKNRQMVITTLLAACVGFSTGSILSHLFYRDRPFVHHMVNQLIEHSANASFPSNHSIGAFAIATGIWLFRKKEGVIWLVLASLIAISRIWNGVHYPSDVITGAFIGVVSTVLIYQLFNRWSVAHTYLSLGIILYEKFEGKIWRRKRIDRPSNFKN